MTIKLLVGLQNPGPDYALTRHNAGAWFLDYFIQQKSLHSRVDKKFHGQLATYLQGDQTFYLLSPSTYMNRSGLSVQAVCQFYRILPEEILVIHDELDLPVGTVRLKTGGGHGGHNGLRDIIAALSSNHFHRLRVGIGHPGHAAQVHDYVLSKPSTTDKQNIMQAIERAYAMMPEVLSGRISHAMTTLNQG